MMLDRIFGLSVTTQNLVSGRTGSELRKQGEDGRERREKMPFWWLGR